MNVFNFKLLMVVHLYEHFNVKNHMFALFLYEIKIQALLMVNMLITMLKVKMLLWKHRKDVFQYPQFYNLVNIKQKYLNLIFYLYYHLSKCLVLQIIKYYLFVFTMDELNKILTFTTFSSKVLSNTRNRRNLSS